MKAKHRLYLRVLKNLKRISSELSVFFKDATLRERDGPQKGQCCCQVTVSLVPEAEQAQIIS